jgi:hypothetical protein
VPLSNDEFAAHVKIEGGGSLGYFNREHVTGRGFMTAAVPEAEHTAEHDLTGKDISKFQEKNASKAAKVPGAIHGAWGRTQDISVKAPTPNAARSMGTTVGEMESYATPHTPVNRQGATVGPHGGAVLLHMGQFGKNSAEESYRPGALDMKGGKGSLTKYEYQNKDWNQKSASGHTLGDVLKQINTNRAMKQRKVIGRE